MLGMQRVICRFAMAPVCSWLAQGRIGWDAFPLSATTRVPIVCKSMHADASCRN